MVTNNMKLIRELYGATQVEIADAIGVNRATISLWESGKFKASFKHCYSLANFYGINPNYFYDIEILDADCVNTLIKKPNFIVSCAFENLPLLTQETMDLIINYLFVLDEKFKTLKALINNMESNLETCTEIIKEIDIDD